MKKRLNLTQEEFSWLISSLILAIITTLFYFIPIFEKTFYIFIFLIPMIISLAFSAYLLIKKFLKG
ncbi:MAG: hypothetical protein J7K78_03395 [Thaumarchaeota archaeon]|nr:hypothetical protein [Nitrososphaerota archaeon]